MKTLFLILFCLIVFPLAGQNGHKKQYAAQRITGVPPVIDGMLDDSAWLQGDWEGGFTQYEPFNGREASQPTFFKILYDDNNLYVAIRALDSSPDSIVTRFTRRDSEDGDMVGIGFDSYFDQRTAFVFGVSSAGVKGDYVMSNDGINEDRTWDPNWHVKTSINEEGWVAEMCIPLSQLRFDKNGGGVWGLQVFRNVYRNRELSFWSRIPRDEPGMVRHSGLLVGIDNLKPGKIFDLTPYAVSSANSYPSINGNPFATGSEFQYKAGLDAKIGLSNNFTLDASLFPDFGQVEADPSEVNLTAYESFFRERRPFFIEGRNISSFQVGLGDGDIGNDNLFYSRRIGRRPVGSISVDNKAYVDRPSFTRILGAAKITGKTESGLSVAIIESVTAEERAEIDISGDRSFKTVEPMTNFFVGRVQQEFAQGNTILGGMFTSVNRSLDDNLSGQMHRAAYSGGVDFTQYFSNKTLQLNVNAAMSHVVGDPAAIQRTQRSSARYFQRPDASHVTFDPERTSLTGTGGKMEFGSFARGKWGYMAALLWKSPEFEINDLGYMREADMILGVVWVGYRQWEPRGIYRNYNINGNVFAPWSFDGTRLFQGGSINGSMQFNNHWSVNGGFSMTHDVTSTTLLRGGPAINLPDSYNGWAGIRTDSRKKLVAGFSTNYNNSQHGYQRSLRLSPGITLRPMENISMSFIPSYTERYNELQYVRETVNNGQTRYIFGSIDQQVVSFSFRINYTIRPDLTIQYWGQPFIASGQYKDFKYITNPGSDSYQDRFHLFTADQKKYDNGVYRVDENMDGQVDYSFGNPNFNFREFISNLVVRWEYASGSSVYLVWSQNRSGFDPNGQINFMNDMGDLFKEKGSNIFLVKLSYRIGM